SGLSERPPSGLRHGALEKQGCIVSKSFGNDACQRRQRPIRRDRDGKRRWLQVSILKWDKNQTALVQFPFHADRRAKGDSSTVPNQRYYEGRFGGCNSTAKLKRSSLDHSIQNHSVGNRMIRKNDEFVLEITQSNGALLCQVM